MALTRRSQRLRNISEAAIALANDPIAKLPDLCIDAVFSYLSPTELIGIQRVSKTWRDRVNWSFGRAVYWKRWFPPLGADDGKVEYDSCEEAALAFRRAVYRHEMRKRGEPTFIRKFTNAFQGWEVCGDYFVWVDGNAMNVQLIFDAQAPGRVVQPIQRFPLHRMCRGDLRVLHVQETSGTGEQPLLALVFIDQTSNTIYPTSKIVVFDVVQGKLLWRVEETKGCVQECTLNKSVLSYLQQPTPSYNALSGERYPASLIVLDVRTGALKSNTKLCRERTSEFIIQGVRAHPRRELIFVLTCKEIMVFSTITMDWLGAIGMVVISTSVQTPGPNGRWELQFDEYGSRCGARDTLSVCGSRYFFDGPGGSLPMRCFVIHQFELPTAEEFEVEDSKAAKDKPIEKGVNADLKFEVGGAEAAKDKPNEKGVNADLKSPLKPIINWKRGPVEILDGKDFLKTNTVIHPEVNLRAKQAAVLLPTRNSKSNTAIIHTYKEEDYVPRVFVVSAVPGQLSSAEGKNEEAETKIKWFTPSVRSEVTKMRKNLPKGTSYASRRMIVNFPNLLGSRNPHLKERYMVFNQDYNVFLLSFSPPW